MTRTNLINKDNKIKESFYKRINLIDIVTEDNTNTKIEEETYQAYKKLKQFLEQN